MVKGTEHKENPQPSLETTPLPQRKPFIYIRKNPTAAGGVWALPFHR